jgi:hypothetical protein
MRRACSSDAQSSAGRDKVGQNSIHLDTFAVQTYSKVKRAFGINDDLITKVLAFFPRRRRRADSPPNVKPKRPTAGRHLEKTAAAAADKFKLRRLLLVVLGYFRERHRIPLGFHLSPFR